MAMQLDLPLLPKNSNEFDVPCLVVEQDRHCAVELPENKSNIVSLDSFRKAKAFAKLAEQAARVVDW